MATERNINYELYWFDQRRKARAFEEAAEEAKREMFPELFFADHEPNRSICRICKHEGYHSEECALRHPDGKDKPRVEDLIQLAKDEPRATKSLEEIERERLQRLQQPAVKPEEQPIAPATETKSGS